MRKKIYMLASVIIVLGIILFHQEISEKVMRVSGVDSPADASTDSTDSDTEAIDGVYRIKTNGKLTLELKFNRMKSSAQDSNIMLFSGIRFNVVEATTDITGSAESGHFKIKEEEIQLNEGTKIHIKSEIDTNITAVKAVIIPKENKIIMSDSILLYNSLYTAKADELTYIY